MNIPIYRAKKIDSDEWVEGYLIPTNSDCTTNDGFSIENSEDYYEIDPTTLSIHFPNMIDKNGKKIFSSLSEDGVGGDIVKDLGGNIALVKFEEGAVNFVFEDETLQIDASIDDWCEIIGIHKGE